MAVSGCQGVEILLLVQTCVYLTLCLLQLVITIPLGDVYNDFDQECILYSELTCSSTVPSNTTGITTTQVQSTACSQNITSITFTAGVCEFLIYTNGGEILYTFLVSIYHIFMFYKSRWNIEIVRELYIKPFLVVNALCAMLGLIMSGIITTGYRWFCNQGENLGITPCKNLEDSKYWHTENQVNAVTATTDLDIAQATLWIGFLVWTFSLAITIIRYMKFSRLRSSERYAEYLQEHAIDMQTLPRPSADDKEETVLFDNSKTPLNMAMRTGK